MGVRVIEGRHPWDGAVLFCSTSMWAFGPVFNSGDDALLFLKWLPIDPRTLTDQELERKYLEFLRVEKTSERETT